MHDEYVVFLKPFRGGRITKGIIPLVRRKAVVVSQRNTGFFLFRDQEEKQLNTACEEEYSVDYRMEGTDTKADGASKGWNKTEAGWRTKPSEGPHKDSLLKSLAGYSIPSRTGVSTAPSVSNTSASLGISDSGGFQVGRFALKALHSAPLPPPSVLRDSKMKTFYRISHGSSHTKRQAELLQEQSATKPKPKLPAKEFLNSGPMNHVKKPMARPKANYLDLQILAGTVSSSSTPMMLHTDNLDNRFSKTRPYAMMQDNFKLGTMKRAVPVFPDEMKIQLSQRTQTAPNSTKPPLFGSMNFPRNYTNNPFDGKGLNGNSHSKVATPQNSSRSRTQDQSANMNRTFNQPKRTDGNLNGWTRGQQHLPGLQHDVQPLATHVTGSKESRGIPRNLSHGASGLSVGGANLVPSNLKIRGNNRVF